MAESVEVKAEVGGPATKKARVQDDLQGLQGYGENLHTVLKDFSEFQQTRILSDNSQRKTICIEGSFNNREGKAIVLLEKKPFNDEILKNTLNSNCVLQKEFSNDIYGFYEFFPSVKYSGE
jgi:hypothetical protein